MMYVPTAPWHCCNWNVADDHDPGASGKVFEVGPRDGLQNERQQLSVATRVALIGALATTSSA